MESVEEKDLIWSQVCGGHPREVTVTESQLKDEWAWLGRENSMGSGLEMGGRDQFQEAERATVAGAEGEREWEELTPAALPAGIWSFYLKGNGESHPLFLHLQIKLPSRHSWVGSSPMRLPVRPYFSGGLACLEVLQARAWGLSRKPEKKATGCPQNMLMLSSRLPAGVG